MSRTCLLLLLLLAACRQGAASGDPHGSKASAEPKPAGPAPAVRPLPTEPPIAFRSPAPDCANVRPIRVGGGVQRPEILRRVEPVYPSDVRRMRIEGIGLLELVINEQGRVCTVQILRGLSPAIDQAMAGAVRQWTFRPARLRGRPVAVAYVITIHLEF